MAMVLRSLRQLFEEPYLVQRIWNTTNSTKGHTRTKRVFQGMTGREIMIRKNERMSSRKEERDGEIDNLVGMSICPHSQLSERSMRGKAT